MAARAKGPARATGLMLVRELARSEEGSAVTHRRNRRAEAALGEGTVTRRVGLGSTEEHCAEFGSPGEVCPARRSRTHRGAKRRLVA